MKRYNSIIQRLYKSRDNWKKGYFLLKNGGQNGNEKPKDRFSLHFDSVYENEKVVVLDKTCFCTLKIGLWKLKKTA